MDHISPHMAEPHLPRVRCGHLQAQTEPWVLSHPQRHLPELPQAEREAEVESDPETLPEQLREKVHSYHLQAGGCSLPGGVGCPRSTLKDTLVMTAAMLPH